MNFKKIHVVAAIIRYNDKILACRRAPHKVSAGFWEFPGGKVELDEAPKVALVREIREELDIEISVGELFDSSITETSNGHIQLDCYFANAADFPTKSTDHDALELIGTKNLLAKNWATPDIPAVTKLARG